MSNPIEIFSGYITKQDWYGALEYLYSSGENDRKAVLDAIDYTCKNPEKPENACTLDEYIVSLAHNAAVKSKRLLKVFNMVGSVYPQVRDVVKQRLEDIADGLVGNAISSNSYGELSALANEIKSFGDAVGWSDKLRNAYIKALAYSSENIRGFIEKFNGGDYASAYEYLRKIVEGKEEQTFRQYLESVGADYNRIVSALLYNYLANRLESAKSAEDVKKVLADYINVLPDDIKKRYDALKVVTDLDRCAENKDFQCASNVIDSAPETLRQSLAEYFMYSVKDKLTTDDYDNVKSFSAKYNLNIQMSEITEQDVKNVANQAIENVSQNVANDLYKEIIDNFNSKNINKLKDLMKSKTDLLKSISIDNYTLYDIVDGLITYMEQIMPLLDDYDNLMKIVKDKMQSYTQGLSKTPDAELDTSLNKLEQTVRMLNSKLSIYRSKLTPLDTIFKSKDNPNPITDLINRFTDSKSYNEILAWIYAQKAVYYFAIGNKAAVDYAKKASGLDSSYADLAMTIELGMNPSSSLVDCILKQIGLGRYVAGTTSMPTTSVSSYTVRGRVLPV